MRQPIEPDPVSTGGGMVMEAAQAFSTISKALQPGERIIWEGTPTPWIAARQFLFPLFFMTFWLGGVLFALWNITNKPSANPNGAALPLIVLCVFVAIGSYSWLQALRAFMGCRNTVYALTDRRVIIAAGGGIQSFYAAALGEISRTGYDARGSLIFASTQNSYSWRSRNFSASNGLYGIFDPARVEALIYQTLVMPKKEGAPR